MEEVTVADVMTRTPVTARPDENLLSCAKKMVRKKVGSLLLKDKRKLVGIISERDILWALIKKSKEDLKNIKAISISPKKIVTIRPTANVKEAIGKMKKFKVKKLPVINDNELLGIVTVKDILNFNPEVYPELEEFARIREETAKLKRIKKAKETAFVEDGICEECGQRGALYRFNGMLMCESCKESI
jgi:CBS domain-containing protein